MNRWFVLGSITLLGMLTFAIGGEKQWPSVFKDDFAKGFLRHR